MLSGVLRTSLAVQVNVAIMRAFVRFRELVLSDSALVRKLEELERRLIDHDGQILELYETIRTLMAGPESEHSQIGFKPEDDQ